MDPVACTFAHVNIIARDWRRLVAFYEEVFGCRPVPPPRRERAAWLARCTGVPGAALEGIHLRLPGRGDDGPTLEIYQYRELLDGPGAPRANRRGLGHLAFAVQDVGAALARLVAAGGAAVGEVVQAEVAGVGRLEVVYAADPEGNLVELQRWS